MAKHETNYEQMGIAAMIPGMQHMIDLMQSELDDMRMRLGILQTGQLPKKRGRPRKEISDDEAKTLDAMLRQREGPSKFNSWVNLTPEEAEARRKVLSDAQRRVRGLPPKTNANGQALLSTGWPADPEERKREQARRRAKWSRDAKARQAAGAAAHWGKKTESEERGVSPQKLAWLRLTPEQKTARLKKAKRALNKGRRALAATNNGGWGKLTPEQRAERIKNASAARTASMAAKAAEDR